MGPLAIRSSNHMKKLYISSDGTIECLLDTACLVIQSSKQLVYVHSLTLYINLCYMQHRGERRGLGGIFFDDLNDYDQEMLLSFATGNF